MPLLVRDRLGLGVPVDLSAEPVRDVAQVADDGGGVACLHVADAPMARLDAGQKILHMRPVLVGAVALDLRGTSTLGDQLEPVTIQVKGRVSSMELHAMSRVAANPVVVPLA